MHERRLQTRYRAKKTPIQIRWDFKDVPNTTRGHLRDISVSGALALTNFAPPEGTLVTVGQDILGAIKAAVIGVTEVVGLSLDQWTSYLVRLEFAESCPEGFLQALAEDFQGSTGVPAC